MLEQLYQQHARDRLLSQRNHHHRQCTPRWQSWWQPHETIPLAAPTILSYITASPIHTAWRSTRSPYNQTKLPFILCLIFQLSTQSQVMWDSQAVYWTSLVPCFAPFSDKPHMQPLLPHKCNSNKYAYKHVRCSHKLINMCNGRHRFLLIIALILSALTYEPIRAPKQKFLIGICTRRRWPITSLNHLPVCHCTDIDAFLSFLSRQRITKSAQFFVVVLALMNDYPSFVLSRITYLIYSRLPCAGKLVSICIETKLSIYV